MKKGSFSKNKRRKHSSGQKPRKTMIEEEPVVKTKLPVEQITVEGFNIIPVTKKLSGLGSAFDNVKGGGEKSKAVCRLAAPTQSHVNQNETSQALKSLKEELMRSRKINPNTSVEEEGEPNPDEVSIKAMKQEYSRAVKPSPVVSHPIKREKRLSASTPRSKNQSLQLKLFGASSGFKIPKKQVNSLSSTKNNDWDDSPTPVTEVMTKSDTKPISVNPRNHFNPLLIRKRNPLKTPVPIGWTPHRSSSSSSNEDGSHSIRKTQTNTDGWGDPSPTFVKPLTPIDDDWTAVDDETTIKSTATNNADGWDDPISVSKPVVVATDDGWNDSPVQGKTTDDSSKKKEVTVNTAASKNEQINSMNGEDRLNDPLCKNDATEKPPEDEGCNNPPQKCNVEKPMEDDGWEKEDSSKNNTQVKPSSVAPNHPRLKTMDSADSAPSNVITKPKQVSFDVLLADTVVKPKVTSEVVPIRIIAPDDLDDDDNDLIW
jgi:hypothetical protein